jgi:hypothetical protein
MVVVVVISVVALLDAGLVRPRLGLNPSSASFTQAGLTSKPTMTFILRNDGGLPLYLDGIDARARGLGAPVVTIASDDVTGTAGRQLHGSIRLGDGGEVFVTMTYESWNCSAIPLGASPTVPVHVHSSLGIHVTESIVPGHLFSSFGTGVPAREIGWSTAITWTSCHTGKGVPYSTIPS